MVSANAERHSRMKKPSLRRAFDGRKNTGGKYRGKLRGYAKKYRGKKYRGKNWGLTKIKKYGIMKFGENMNGIMAIDIDGVTAETDEVWLARYNKDYNDDFTVEEWTDWDIHKLIKPECGMKIYDYLTPDLYDDVLPVKGAQEGIEKLKKIYRVIFLTTFDGLGNAKYEWLKKYGFLNRKEDFVIAADKSLTLAKYLIDDKPEYVISFSQGIGRSGILFDRPWNRHIEWKLRIKDWNTFYPYLSYLKGD